MNIQATQDDMCVTVNRSHGPYVDVNWRLSEELIAELSTVPSKLYMLISVVVEYGDDVYHVQARHLVPLDRGSATIALMYRGKYSVHSTVVWQSSQREYRLRKTVMKFYTKNYATAIEPSLFPDLVRPNHYYQSSFDQVKTMSISSIGYSTSHKIVMPEQTERLHRMIDWMDQTAGIKGPVKNRRTMAKVMALWSLMVVALVGLTPFILLGAILVSLPVGFFLLIGKRNIDYAELTNENSLLSEAFTNMTPSVYLWRACSESELTESSHTIVKDYQLYEFRFNQLLGVYRFFVRNNTIHVNGVQTQKVRRRQRNLTKLQKVNPAELENSVS